MNRRIAGHFRAGPSAATLRRIPIGVLAFVVLMILPPAASAASGADPSNPSLDQYVESVPTSHGGQPPPGGSTRGHLSDSARHALATHGGSDAKQLEVVATSPALGAPTSSRANAGSDSASGSGAGGGSTRSGGSGHSGSNTPAAADERGPSGIDALTTAATSGDGSSMGALVAGLVLIAAIAGGMGLARRRGALG